MNYDEEERVLREAAVACVGWARRLPTWSEWRGALMSIAGDMMASVETLGGAGEASPGGDQWLREYRERRAPWTELTVFERDRLTLETIGDDGPLTITEATAKLNAHFGDDIVDASHVRSIVSRLHAAGELARVRVPPGEAKGKRNGTRWRYSRRALSGPIADLERAWHDDEGASR